ncbi:MAG: queuosine salvage family protein [Sporichthyaceae bacterium]
MLTSILPVIEASKHVRTDETRLVDVASWLACEELPMPQFLLPFRPAGDRGDVIDFIMVCASIDFAFTDFATRTKFEVEDDGQVWSDSDALFVCVGRAPARGDDLGDGHRLRTITAEELDGIFAGNITMPMLEERAAILRNIGTALVDSYGGRFRNVIEAASPRLYDEGAGLIDRLVADFPRFRDVSLYDGQSVAFYKLAQLAVWMLYTSLGEWGALRVDDIDTMTAFADYIVPAGLQVMGVLTYSDALAATIRDGRLIDADSPEEVEIRAHTIYATALVAEEVNLRREPGATVIDPQIDARLWTHFHTTAWPHHLIRTTMY